MAVEINPIPLTGSWDIGFALDQHIIRSIPMGEDAYGNQRFDSTRSHIGELLYQFKYNNRYDCLSEIVDTIYVFLKQTPQIMDIETILPVPPTPTNNRFYQPTLEIAQALAKRINVFYCSDVLEKQSLVESKALSSDEKYKLKGSIVKRKNSLRKHNVLLIDDLYKTGMTLEQCVKELRTDPLIGKIFVLTITKTKNQ